MSALKNIIYLDHNATTPLDPDVFDAMKPYFLESFGNASSIDHLYGSEASSAVEIARKKISKSIGAQPREIVFTSGATESDNLAISGIMTRYQDKGDHMITCVTEHEAVLNAARHMEKLGKKMTYLPVNEFGHIDIEELKDAITDRTILISIMAANNEIGVIHDIKEIGKMAHERGVLFHTDAAQAVGHIPMDVEKTGIDLMSFSAHKMYGPKGIGALYIRGLKPRIQLDAMIHGGNQERGIRSGTLNVPSIVGFGKAIEIAMQVMYTEAARLTKISRLMIDLFEDGGALLNGDRMKRLPGNINVAFPGIEGKAIINSVSKKIAISAGSACNTQSVEPSHVIFALGYDERHAHSSIRIGLGRSNTENDSKATVDCINSAVKSLTAISLV